MKINHIMVYNLIKYQSFNKAKTLLYKELFVIQPHFVFIVLAHHGNLSADGDLYSENFGELGLEIAKDGMIL